MTESDRPWATGPGEILRHGVDLLTADSDTNRRLAMIAIDNAVELMFKTYLGLPKRVTRLSISRKEYQEIAESFPALLDAMEKHAADKLKGVDLAEIEWYHRLRNQLYHQGNGLTVERQKVEIYAELANILFSNLFGGSPKVRAASLSLGVVGEFLAAWYALEQGVMSVASEMTEPGRPLRQISDAVRRLRNEGRLSVNDEQDLHELRALRNLVARGEPGSEQRSTNEVIQKVWSFVKRFPMQPPPAAV